MWDFPYFIFFILIVSLAEFGKYFQKVIKSQLTQNINNKKVQEATDWRSIQVLYKHVCHL